VSEHTGSLVSELEKQRITVLLVDDQPFVGEAVRRMLASSADIDFHFCADPKLALQRGREVAPTVILQDLVMPEVDGLTLLKAFRADEATRDVPMIVLSTKEEPKVKAEAFALGAHDYLVKLPDPIELVARIRHHSAGYIAQRQRNAAFEALKQSEQRLAGELAEAAKYVVSMLPERLTGSVETDWQFIPSVHLGGDSFGHHWIDKDHFAIYLLDVCGHGVRSALLSISAMNAVRSEALPATDFRQPQQVLSALNEVFDMEKHDGMYFTMWYGVYVRSTRELRFSTGGHPPAVVVRGANGRAQATPLVLNGMIVGAFPTTKFESQRVRIEPSDRLYVYSDGVYEVTKPDGSMWTMDGFIETLLTAGDKPVLPHLIDTVRQVRGSSDFEDDVSILEVRFADGNNR
jgi:sigma-B regulation protein RsbU (phosphoserine phosphatase)